MKWDQVLCSIINESSVLTNGSVSYKSENEDVPEASRLVAGCNLLSVSTGNYDCYVLL